MIVLLLLWQLEKISKHVDQSRLPSESYLKEQLGESEDAFENDSSSLTMLSNQIATPTRFNRAKYLIRGLLIDTSLDL